MEYLYSIIIFILIYAVCVQSLNLIMGYVGIVSMCHAIFVAVGAYTAALLSIHLGYNFIAGTLAGFVLAAIIGALLAAPSLRVKDEYIIVFTAGFQMVAYEFMLTARNVTQGQGGITNIPAPTIFGMEIQSSFGYLMLILVISFICFAVAWRVTHSPFSRVLKAIREDETACRALGKNTLQFKVVLFALGGGIAAIAGSTLAYYVTFISPFTFTMDNSISLIVMVVLGGLASFWGPLVGAAILVGLPEALRFMPGTAGVIDAIREILYGAILVILMLFRSQGILPEYSRKIGRSPLREDLPPGEGPENSEKEDEAAAHRQSREQTILEVKGVSKSFGGLRAVADASLTLPFGKITGLIGPNGCGKTTLFNLITGFLAPDAGDIYIQGEKVTNQAPYKFVNWGLARSWQDVRIFKGMTVLDNVLVGGTRQSGENLAFLFFAPGRVAREEKEIHKKAMEYLYLVGLPDKAGHLASSLSNAEQKLVAIARLLATEAPVLLLDEPTAALDLESVERIIQLIRRIARQGRRTILLIEHNLDVVRELVENAYFMSEGKILACGEPAKLMADPALAQVYFGID
jgi:ABC-type branched-subunit amino acid transport system ATPase component/ABC-type branched-subunit amino acid transport system permease subunit